MIRRVTIKRFKRFEEESFFFDGSIVLAGPNNMGKTTILQAIAAWGLAFDRWKRNNDFTKHGGYFAMVPITRQTFSAVPLRVYVRPSRNVPGPTARDAKLRTVYVPPMTGLSIDEPIYQPVKIDQLLGQSRPGEVLRNLIIEVLHSEAAWTRLSDAIRRLFGYELMPPNGEGPDIIAEFSHMVGGPRFDIANSGSGFQQVLMLVTFLLTRPASVLPLKSHLNYVMADTKIWEQSAAYVTR